MEGTNYTRLGQTLQRNEISVYSCMMNPSDLLEQIQQRSPHLPSTRWSKDFITQMDPDYLEGFSCQHHCSTCGANAPAHIPTTLRPNHRTPSLPTISTAFSGV